MSLNPGPILFSIVRKDPVPSAMTETHIRPTDNDRFLRSITAVGVNVNKNMKFKIFARPTYTFFKSIVIAIGSSTRHFMMCLLTIWLMF